jgi:predicted secreted Zn-dependent protease
MQHDLHRAVWRKANGSGDGNCVEVAVTPAIVGVRDTKDRSGPILAFTPDIWSGFVAGVKAGDFDRL